jgi:diguanylate cyclase (GGDEF)-like protein
MNLLSDECRFALEMGKPFCIALIDIDQMRKINDEFGIAAGDALLAGAAETVRSVLDLPQWHNLQALIGRYDGDSLILLMPGCRLDRAEQFAYVIKQRIARFRHDGVSSTVSTAIAACKGDDTVDELLARAEKTMCLAKQFGGDAVEVARTAELTRDLASVTPLPVAWRGQSRRSA